MLCSRGEWESTRCTRSAVTHPSARLNSTYPTSLEQLLYTSWQECLNRISCSPVKKQKNKHKKIGHKLYIGDHYLPSVSPLLSSGFVPGLFSWSTVCALDEEHPMFGKKELRWLEEKKKDLDLNVIAKTSPQCSLLAKTEPVWQREHGQLQHSSSVPKRSWAPLSPLVTLCVYAWPAALLPQILLWECSWAVQALLLKVPWMYPAHSHSIHIGGGGERGGGGGAGEKHVLGASFLPLIGVSQLEDPPPGGNV